MIKIIRISLLSIERRRWQNIDRNLRICNLCDKKEIGDEFHYILEYNYFNNIRKKCIDNHYRKRQNIIKFGELMSIENQIKLTKHQNKSVKIKQKTFKGYDKNYKNKSVKLNNKVLTILLLY